MGSKEVEVQPKPVSDQKDCLIVGLESILHHLISQKSGLNVTVDVKYLSFPKVPYVLSFSEDNPATAVAVPLPDCKTGILVVNRFKKNFPVNGKVPLQILSLEDMNSVPLSDGVPHVSNRLAELQKIFLSVLHSGEHISGKLQTSVGVQLYFGEVR